MSPRFWASSTRFPATAVVLVVLLRGGRIDEDALGTHQVSIWPNGALQARTGGQVVLTCRVSVHGLAEACRVALGTRPVATSSMSAATVSPSSSISRQPSTLLRAVTSAPIH